MTTGFLVPEHNRTNYSIRDRVLKLLWADDIARVGPAMIPARLERGDEFVDLQLLERGVQQAIGVTAPTGGVLARKAVQPNTWTQILEQLPGRRLP